MTTADMPGPPQPTHFAGARLLEAFPVRPLIANVTMGIGALFYAGQLNITVVADRDALPASTPSPPPPEADCGHSANPSQPSSGREDVRHW